MYGIVTEPEISHNDIRYTKELNKKKPFKSY